MLARVFVILVLVVSLGTMRTWNTPGSEAVAAQVEVVPDALALEEAVLTRHVTCSSQPAVVRTLTQVRADSPPPSIDTGRVFRPPRSSDS